MHNTENAGKCQLWVTYTPAGKHKDGKLFFYSSVNTQGMMIQSTRVPLNDATHPPASEKKPTSPLELDKP